MLLKCMWLVLKKNKQKNKPTLFISCEQTNFFTCCFALLQTLQFKEIWKLDSKIFQGFILHVSLLSESTYPVLLVAKKSETVSAKHPKSN